MTTAHFNIHYSLRQLKYFVAATDALSFTAASKVLHISQPSISAAISELETSFGVQLFVRHHAQGLSLTQAGRGLLREARALLQHADELQAFAQEMGNGISGTITLGCLVSLAPPLMPALISRFVAEFPSIAFDTVETHQEDLLAGLLNGEFDIGLTYDLRIPTGIQFISLLPLPPYVLLPAEHTLAKRRGAVSLGDLVDEPYVLLDLPHSREYFLSLFDGFSHCPRIAFKSAQPEVVRGLVSNGLGFTILNFPIQSCKTVDGQAFVIKKLKDTLRGMELGIALAEKVAHRRIIDLFIKFCEIDLPLIGKG